MILFEKFQLLEIFSRHGFAVSGEGVAGAEPPLPPLPAGAKLPPLSAAGGCTLIYC